MVAQERDTVSAAVHAAAALLHPLRWQHIYLPLLPLALKVPLPLHLLYTHLSKNSPASRQAPRACCIDMHLPGDSQTTCRWHQAPFTLGDPLS